MAFKAGHKKMGGRSAGTPNKGTLTFIEKLEASNFDTWSEFLKIFPALEPQVKAKVLLELMNYEYPKRKAIEHSGQTATSITFEKLDGTGEKYTLGESEDDDA